MKMSFARVEHIKGTSRYKLLNYDSEVFCLDLDSNPIFAILPFLVYILPIKVYQINPETVQKKIYRIVNMTLLIGCSTIISTFVRINYSKEIVDISINTRILITFVVCSLLLIVRYGWRYKHNQVSNQKVLFKVFLFPVGVKAKLLLFAGFIVYITLMIGGLWIAIFLEANLVLFIVGLLFLIMYTYLNMLTIKDAKYVVKITDDIRSN